MGHRIYLDHNASTPIDPRVLQAVIEELKEEIGNPSSVHFHGQKCRQRLDQSRRIIARFLNVRPHEIIFTSGGTEGANLLLHGLFQGLSGGHLITSSAEHSCVYQTAFALEKQGHAVTFLNTGLWGAVTPDAVKAAIRPDTRAIALMAVNNETGVKTDIEAIAAVAQEAQIPLIVDGVAWLGKESFFIPAGVSAMFFSGHKVHAPKGIGFVYCKSGLKLHPFLTGGTQEFNRRAGTENLPAIIGLAKAVEILTDEQEMISVHMRQMRDRLEQGLMSQLNEVVMNGQGPRVVNVSNLSFLKIDGESLLIYLDKEGISVSHGSACSSGALEPSRILLKMNIPLSQARSSLRLSVSRFTTEAEIDFAIETIVRLVKRMRAFRAAS
jgi:cysteine desulfurase